MAKMAKPKAEPKAGKILIEKIYLSEAVYDKFGSKNRLIEHIERTADLPQENGFLLLTPEQKDELCSILGPINTSNDVVDKTRRLAEVSVGGLKFELEKEQLVRIKNQAFFNRKQSEPSELEATPQQAKEMIERYLSLQMKYFLDQF